MPKLAWWQTLGAQKNHISLQGVAAVVLRVDSPGGDALASDLMWRQIQRTAKLKPVIASMGDVAASGGESAVGCVVSHLYGVCWLAEASRSVRMACSRSPWSCPWVTWRPLWQ